MNFHLLLNRCSCEYRCVFCTMGGQQHRTNQESLLADFDYEAEWQRIEASLQTGLASADLEALHIMGNDPLAHPDIVRVVTRARELGFPTIVLETNGVRLADPELTERLVAAGVECFKIPIYGSTAAVHDGIVRLPGAFDRLMIAFEHLSRHPVVVHLHSLVLRQNAHDLAACKFPFQLAFRYPFRHDGADLPYERYAPRLSDVPFAVLQVSDLVIPCINGRRTHIEQVEARVRPEAPGQCDVDRNVTLPYNGRASAPSTHARTSQPVVGSTRCTTTPTARASLPTAPCRRSGRCTATRRPPGTTAWDDRRRSPLAGGRAGV